MRIIVLVLFFTLTLSNCLNAQEQDFRILFYNVENYFDPVNDSVTMDDEFTEEGARHWSWYKYNEKTAKIYKAITAVSGWQQPDIIALCEIENRYVLNNLLKRTPLGESGYKIIHQESDDFRGIDVGLFYQKETVWPLSEQFIKVRFKNKPDKTTRDILHFKALLKNKDTLHVFVNHWPSKYGGAIATIPYRAEAARTLKNVTDSILQKNPKANIVITGDFNDTPEDESLKTHLGAKPPKTESKDALINLSSAIDKSQYPGTHRFHGKWSMLDQFIVSPAMIDKKNSMYTNVDNFTIGYIDLLLEKDKKHTGKKPNRTFIGFKYHGGFSDHLPIMLDLELQ